MIKLPKVAALIYNSTCGYTPNRCECYTHQKTYTMLIAALSVIIKNYK